MRIHWVRHTYSPGEPLLPWVYAIARCVQARGPRHCPKNRDPAFEDLVASLPEGQPEVLTMLKVNGLSLEEVARATSSTLGAVKQKAHRSYQECNVLEHSHLSTPPR